MKIYVPNLHRRPDKKEVVLNKLSENGFHDVRVINSHDYQNYANMACLLDAMRCGGYEIGDVEFGDLTGDKDSNQIPIIPEAHMAFRWTYLDILRLISYGDDPGCILIDDMEIYKGTPLDRYGSLLDSADGHVLCLDPLIPSMQQMEGHHIFMGYYAPTEEANIWTPAGARHAIPILLEYPELVIGDLMRKYYSICYTYSVTKPVASVIGDKKDWDSDIHVNSDSVFKWDF